ncbi:MAG: PspA/IM30 family protein [Rhodanobacteraceae bacterium]|nr:PspA/IM30 family protein [Rhodanobacteraceae bacterium]
MAIAARITRLFTADVHAVLDRLEEPEALLRQAIRDMESALAEQVRRLQALALEREQLDRRSAEIERALAGVAGELDLSFAAGNEALVRRCLRRKLEGERMQRLHAQRREQVLALVAQLTPQIEQQRERLEAMRQKAALFDVEPPGCEESHVGSDDACVSEADIDLALLREQQARRAS